MFTMMNKAPCKKIQSTQTENLRLLHTLSLSHLSHEQVTLASSKD